MLLNILQCIAHPSITKNYLAPDVNNTEVDLVIFIVAFKRSRKKMVNSRVEHSFYGPTPYNKPLNISEFVLE